MEILEFSLIHFLIRYKRKEHENKMEIILVTHISFRKGIVSPVVEREIPV